MGRIQAAGCLLPLTEDRTLSTELGTRHRAAIGLSEQTDAVVVVVSEETRCHFLYLWRTYLSSLTRRSN